MSQLIAPSLLAADFANLKDEIEMINRSETDWIHLDIMDGVFVPNISFGFPVIEQVAKLCSKPLDVHLMIVEPQKFIPEFKRIGVHMLNVHFEACTHLHRTIQEIKSAGMKAAVTLNPHTPVSLLEEILPELDMVLLMSVNPGFGGQKFIEGTLDKVTKLKAMIDSKKLSTLIQIDGGVNYQTAKQLIDRGADVLVAGSFVFGADNPEEVISNLKAL